MIDTVFHVGETPIRVSHDCCSDPIGRTEDGLLVRSNDAKSETLTTIDVGPPGESCRIYVYWSLVLTGEHFNLLFVPSTQVLFVGGGSLSAAIDTSSMSLVHQNDTFLFWAFERRRDFVLELGELVCSLYDLRGNCIASVPADPPYDVTESNRGIKVASSSSGSQWLNFPV